MIELNITPVTAPRQNRSDAWRERPSVKKYRDYRDKVNDELNKGGEWQPALEGAVLFVMPMAKSWSNKKKESKLGTVHDQKPDVDNLLKAWLDSLFRDKDMDDALVHTYLVRKVWGYEGKIVFSTLDEIDSILSYEVQGQK